MEEGTSEDQAKTGREGLCSSSEDRHAKLKLLLLVDVAKGTRSGVGKVLDGNLAARVAEVDDLVGAGQVAGRLVPPGLVGVQPLAEVVQAGGAVLLLPQEPHAVHLAVVDKKGRVVGRGEDVAAGVAAHDVVAAAVRANLHRALLALGHYSERVNVGGRQKVEDGGVVGEAHVDAGADVALPRARVLAQAVVGACGHALDGSDGTQKDGAV